MQGDAKSPVENSRLGLKEIAIPAASVLIASRAARAYTFVPIERDQKPDQTDAAIIYNGIKPDYEAVRKDIKALIAARPEKGPTLVRLAWHSSGTYDRISKTGGSQLGTIRFKEELAHGANAGLDMAISWLEPIYKKANRDADLSYADLYTFAGIVAIEEMGGPKIGWRAGRMDSVEVTDVTPDGRLPDADKGSSEKTASHLRDVFGRMGFDDQEIVALSGAHALGRCHVSASGYVGPWSPTPTKFNNAYFSLLLGLQWAPNKDKKKVRFNQLSADTTQPVFWGCLVCEVHRLGLYSLPLLLFAFFLPPFHSRTVVCISFSLPCARTFCQMLSCCRHDMPPNSSMQIRVGD